jgi:HK97 gp10 family phage protein
MPRPAVDPANLNRILRKFDRVQESVEIATREELKDAAQNTLALAQQLAPVAEGELVRSGFWDWDEADFAAIVGFRAPHAVFVEFGTRTMPARPFLWPAYKHQEPIFRATLEQRISNELRKVRRYL